MRDTMVLQTDLNAVVKWSTENNMQLHEDKFELLSYRIPKIKYITDALPFMTDIASYITPAGFEIERSSVVRDLGITMIDDFQWTSHINNMVKNARIIASWILGVFSDRSKESMLLQLYKSILRSRVDCLRLQKQLESAKNMAWKCTNWLQNAKNGLTLRKWLELAKHGLKLRNMA